MSVLQGVSVMVAVTEIEKRRARCAEPLARLRLLAIFEVGEPLPPDLADQVNQASLLVLSEAQAATLAAAAGSGAGHGAAVTRFLNARLRRLVTVAEQAVRAAKDDDAAALRQHLARFEALTSALWTVQIAVSGSAAADSVHDEVRLAGVGARPSASLQNT
jgi:hypothetical protein